ncbi:DEAD/DEAH box helicase family protein [Gemella sp. 19428wG2_WT2a]|nr:DEAD/DEAH box helicase family protein [Gemella sp. 19428wG2_WT2a]TFU60041.1 DEAD/DEAH box helicase [Gemella sp. WT2a]
MYFSSNLEFIPAFFHIHYSNYDEKIKKNLLDEIYQEYTDSTFTDIEVEQIFFELKYGNFKEIIDLKFLNSYRGRIFSIDQLVKKKIKIHYLEKANCIEVISTIRDSKCLMCSSKNLYSYYASFDKITYCLDCIDFGISKSNEIRFLINNYKNEPCHFTIPSIALSDQQKIASDLLVENSKANKSSLIWAVCGAGKTEIIYKLISNYLKENKIICLAIPRKDIVNELASRIKKDFSLEINLLHGDDKKLLGSNFYIMTCHQLFHYYKFFDLIIVDEVDAFPYNGNDVLEYGMKKALKDQAPLIFLSATPSKKIKKSVDSVYKLPIRYHGNLLPVPNLKIHKDFNKNIFSTNILNTLDKIIRFSTNKNRRLLIFVPTIKIGEELAKSTAYNFVSSKTENRNDLIEGFRNKKFNVLITTTILERGLTFDYLDIVVFHSSHKTFSKEALIQISGRVGRKAYDPSGSIIFYSGEHTKAIKSAIKEIKYMNELAKYRKLVK